MSQNGPVLNPYISVQNSSIRENEIYCKKKIGLVIVVCLASKNVVVVFCQAI